MDPDVEFNALSALYQSVMTDIKQSYTAWDTVGQRALKLSHQLRNTVQCLTAFIDSVQGVSDFAHNLKGASRDIGACVTRVCMRERAMESRLRSIADALSDELVVGIQQRSGYWKQRTCELDKVVSKHIKKVRSKKGRPDEPSLMEHRQLCSQVLMEQRSQFSFFIGILTPFLTAQIGLLDEGPHIRQVSETLADTVKCVDSTSLIKTIVGDLSQGAENAWKSCLASANQSFNSREDSISSRAATPCSNFGDNDMTPQATRLHTISAGTRFDHQYITSQTFVPPNKPPLHKRAIDKSLKNISPPSIPPVSSFYGSHYDLGNSPSGKIQRPQSFTGELRTNYQVSPMNGHNSLIHTSSSCSSSESSSAALIAETLQQIDQLGSDLDSYCSSTPMRDCSTLRSNGGSSSTIYSSGNGVRMRSESGSRPPPPARRSSTITAATPTAPSVAEARMNMGSRQSLNTVGLYQCNSNTDLRYSNVNPYQRQTSLQPNFNL